jgi:hypothetical protein
MDENKRSELIQTAWEMHRAVEESYLGHSATSREGRHKGEWLEKQRLLLADMAIHLLQTAIKPGAIELEKLKNNLHAILTISDEFLPLAELKKATEKIYIDR